MMDSEKVHRKIVKLGKRFGEDIGMRRLVSDLFDFQDNKLKQEVLGIKFRNPVGLSAGFDKNGEIIGIMEDVGFGFTEIGSVTALQCPGNKGKRMSRLVDKKSLWVNLGLNNNGVDEIVSRLSKKRYGIPYGISIAYTNCEDNKDTGIALKDYILSLKRVNERNVGNYVTLNISCPSLKKDRPFLDPGEFEKLMKEVKKVKFEKPLFVKLSPDVKKKDVDSIMRIAKKYGISGIVCTNLSKNHNLKSGGLSGKAVEKESDEMLKYVSQVNKKKKYGFVLIGVGGIFSGEDAYRKIKLGANLVQLITGMIYEGPQLIGQINNGLVGLLEKDGFSEISEAVGKDIK